MARHGRATRALSLLTLVTTLTSIACARPPAMTARVPVPGDPPSAAVTVDRDASPPTGRAVQEVYARLPLHFEENRGQADPAARYVARGRGWQFLLGVDAIVFEARTDRVRLLLPGSRRGVSPEALEPLPGRISYFAGREARHWMTDVPTYARVRYAEVYPGIDLVFYGNLRRVEYDFVVSPGADPARIRMRFEGADGVEADPDGGFVVTMRRGRLRQARPVLYQDIDGVRRAVSGTYVVGGSGDISLKIGVYDHRYPLVIDPVIAYSTLISAQCR